MQNDSEFKKKLFEINYDLKRPDYYSLSCDSSDHDFLTAKKDIGLSEFYFANSLTQVEKLQNFPVMLKPFDEMKMRMFFAELPQKLFVQIKPQE